MAGASEARGLYLKPPEKLPLSGVNKITFKVFYNQLVAYLEQDPNNYMFLKGGIYSKWSPKIDGRRISALQVTDPDLVRTKKDFAEHKDNDRYENERMRIINLRETQCSKFITLIAVLCYYTEQDDINQHSLSLSWIDNYLKKHYNLESRGEHFLDIAALTFKKGTNHQTFFKQFRAGFMDNLRRKGDLLEFRENEKLNEDERMSPTLESTIVLWALERIDPRLPVKVQKQYGHQLVGNKCLVTLQPTIFQNIAGMAEPRTNAHALAAEDDCQLNAGWSGRGVQQRGSGRAGFSRGGRHPFQRGHDRGRGHAGQGGGRGARPYSKKFCRICYHAGSPEFVYQSHTISECTKLTSADKTDLRAVLGVGEVELCQDWKEEPRESRQDMFQAPGWDMEDNLSCDVKGINYTKPYSDSKLIHLNTMTPVPSQRMDTLYHGMILPVTLDSGATLSFMRLWEVLSLGIAIYPNGQLATLADEETRLASKGEIDIEVVVNGYVLRLRALVMDKLTAVCFGCTNFHKDNRITADICGGSIMLHGQYTISQSNPLINIESFPPSRIRENSSSLCQLRTDVQVVHQVKEVQDEEVVTAEMLDSIDKDKYKVMAGQISRSRTVNIASRQKALPGEIMPIQVHD